MPIDPVIELLDRSTDHVELRKFRAFHFAHPEVLDFLVTELRLRFTQGFKAFSIASLWHYARWKLDLSRGPDHTYQMNDHLVPFYGRAILILHPEFNGCCELRTTLADKLFGTAIEPERSGSPELYARRLIWEDGKGLERGWRPATPHVPTRLARRKADIH